MNIETRDSPPFRVILLSGTSIQHSSPQARQLILDSLKAGKAAARRSFRRQLHGQFRRRQPVEGYQTARKQGSNSVSPRRQAPAMSVLKLARLDKVFPIHASLEERLARG